MATAVVIQVENISYAACGGLSKDINCATSQAQGDYWGVPAKENGQFRGYKLQKATSAPTPDSIPVVRVRDTDLGTTFHLLGTGAQFRTACSGGAAMPLSSTIPIPVPEYTPCPLTDGSYVWDYTPPAKAGGQTYTVAAMYNNTQPVAPGTGLADLAAIVTYLNTNYSAAGTFSAVSGRVHLVRSAGAGAAKFGLVFKVV